MARFEEGNKAGVGHGRPSLPNDLKEARKANSQDVERIINKFLGWAVSDLAEYCKDPHNPVLECLIASILAKAIHQGDPMRLGFILDRLGIKAPVQSKESEEQNLHSQIVSVVNQIEGKKSDKPD